MTETTSFEQLLQNLATANNPSEQAALIAESAFAKLLPTVAFVARRCIILHWFDTTILTALLPEATEPETYLSAGEIAKQLAQLPFVERLPWGLAYHEQTRAGLLAHYVIEQPELLKAAAAAAAAAYRRYADQTLAASEVLFCLIISGQLNEALQQLDQLINEVWRREDWNGLLALFTICDQAAALSFVTPIQPIPFHCYAQGVALRQLGNRKEAIAAHQRAIALDEKYAYPWNGLGATYRDLKRYEEAISAYQQSIALDEKYAYPWNGLGNVYHDLKLYEQAITAYQQAIAIDDRFTYPWNGLGAAYRDLKRYEEAIVAYQQAIALDEKYAYPWNGLGNVYRDLKHYDKAIAAYQQSIALDDKFTYPWNGLGAAYSDQKRFEDAITAYKRAIALDEKYAYPWNGLGNVYRDLKRYEEAISAYQRAIALDNNDAYLHADLATLLRLLERWNEAEAAAQRALAIDPSDWTEWYVVADSMRRRGDQSGWQQAIAQAQPLVDYNDFYNAACFESVAGNTDRALELLEQAAQQEHFDASWAQEDPDLYWIRHDPRFEKIIKTG